MRVPCQEGARRRRTHPALPAAVTAAVVGFGVWAYCDGRAALDDWLRARGHHTVEHRTPTWQALLQLAGRAVGHAAAPHLDLQIAFEQVERLRAMQRDALRKGRIDAAAKETVPAVLAHAGGRTKVKLRLKGDNIDHVAGRRVSFRVQVTHDPPVLSMRTFSLQAPETKGYHLEALFHASVRAVGCMSPRYEFVHVTCNGEDFGVMALEEVCAKEMQEREGSRESTVVRFEEDQMFAAQDRLRSTDPRDVALDDYRTAPVRAMVGDRLPQQGQALGLLRAFVSGVLAPSDVFDVEAVAAYLAVCELWGAWHPLRWHNLRFYYDPMSGRLAPVGFDGNLQMRRPIGQLVTPSEPIVARMLADPAVFAAFRLRLRALCAAVQAGEFVATLQAAEREALPRLHASYPLLQPFACDELRERADLLLKLQDASFRDAGGDSGLRAVFLAAVGGDRFEVRNVAPWPVVVHGARWLRPDGSTLAAEPVGMALPCTLAAKPEAGPIPPLAFTCAPPAEARGASLQLEARVATVAERYWVEALPQAPVAVVPSIPSADLEGLLRRWPWLQQGAGSRTLRIAPGTHRVDAVVVLPLGCRLTAGAGTRLEFAKEAALVVQAGIDFVGTAEAPVELVAAAGSWRGLLVRASAPDEPSTFRHVCVRDTTGVLVGALEFTGGCVFHRGRVEVDQVRIDGTTAEDAINIVHAEVAVRGLHILHTRSDALDGDFVHGVVEDSEFEDIGGDAVDVSGSQIRIVRCRVRGGRDKAVSVGEASQVDVEGLVAERVGVGAACKDGSVMSLTNTRIVDPSCAGVMSYVKKPEFGPCRSTIAGLVVEGTVPAVRIQNGCVASRDGVPVATEAIDVENLYATVMKK